MACCQNTNRLPQWGHPGKWVKISFFVTTIRRLNQKTDFYAVWFINPRLLHFVGGPNRSWGVQQIQDGRRPPSWKIEKWPILSISRQRFDWSARNLSWCHILALRMARIQHGGRLPSFKMDKLPYLGYSLTDRCKVWHDDSYWPFKSCWQLKFPTLANPRWRIAAILKIWSMAWQIGV